MEISWLITSILGFALLYFIYWIITDGLNYWGKRGIPYAISSPVAALKHILLPKKSQTELFLDFYKKQEGEKFYGSYDMFTPALFIRDLELINHILIKDFSCFVDRQPPINKNELFALSLFSLSGNKWRYARHRLTPTFTSGKLKRMFFSIKECSDEFVIYIKGKSHEDLQVKQLASKLLLNVIGKVAFGLNIDSINEKEENEFVKNALNIFKPSFTIIIKVILTKLLPILFNFKIFGNKTEDFFRKLTKDLIKYRENSGERRNDFLQIMLDEKKKESNDQSRNDFKNYLSDHNEALGPEDRELIDQLENIQSGEKNSSVQPVEIFSEDFMAAQAFTFLLAGSESTSSAISFALYELALNQDVQIKLQNEISDVLSSHEFTYEAVSKMNYLEQCINETLRLYPFVPILVRSCTQDYKLPGANIMLKKGNIVIIPVIGLHKDAKYFKEPEKFDPDRFDNMKYIPKGAYLPFGGGPRFCIAMRLAILEIKVVLATLLTHFTVDLSEKTKLPLSFKKYSFFPEVEGGMWLKFKTRDS